MTTRNEMAEQAAELIGAAILRIHRETGMPMECVLAGAHAEVVALMTSLVGGPMTAHCCEMAAAKVRCLPSANAMRLASAAPAGSA